jgi:hypothetical protein
MTSIQFVVHPLPGTQEQLQEKLREVADRLNKYNTSGTAPAFSVFRIRIGTGSGPDPDPGEGSTSTTPQVPYVTQVILAVFRIPDPNWIRTQSGQWIRIRIQEGKNDLLK